MRTSNEAPGTATLASPHNRLAWLLARQYRLAGIGHPETLEMVSWPLFCDTVCGIPCPEFLVAGTAQGGGQSRLYCAREVGVGREGASGLGMVTFKEKAVMSRWREVGNGHGLCSPGTPQSSVTSPATSSHRRPT